MKAALLAPLALFVASEADARFAPRLGVDYRLTSTATSERGAQRNTFTLVRAIRFERRHGGYLATVTVRSVASTGVTDVAASFDRAYAALLDLPMTVELGPMGEAGAVRDATTIWAKMRDALAVQTGGATAAAMWDSVPVERRSTVLASALTGVIAGADADRAATVRPTTIPARAFGGAGADLPASETVTTDRRQVTIDLSADGATGAGGSVRLRRHRVIDRRTGLAIARREDVTTTLLLDGEPQTNRTVQEHTIE